MPFHLELKYSTKHIAKYTLFLNLIATQKSPCAVNTCDPMFVVNWQWASDRTCFELHLEHAVQPVEPSGHYTGCPRRNVPDFGRVFLMLKYTDITQNTYIQS